MSSKSEQSLNRNAYVQNTCAPNTDDQTMLPLEHLVIIDAAVSDYEILASGVISGAKVAILQPDRDGVEQISTLLAQYQHVKTLHIVSHGESAALQLGASWLRLSSLSDYASALQTWSKYLSPEAEILLYGCNVAAGTLGKNFVYCLSELTGAKVAASESLTGSATLGGNWQLEVSTGERKSPLGVEQAALAAYKSVLSVSPINSRGTSGGSVIANGALYYITQDVYYPFPNRPIGYSQLWKQDGTGTKPIKSSATYFGGLMKTYIDRLTNVNGVIYFAITYVKYSGSSDFNDTYFYRINNDTDSAEQLLMPDSFPLEQIDINGTPYLVFRGNGGYELWKEDNFNYFKLVKYGFSRATRPGNLTNLNGTLYFTADDGINGNELWKSDGTTEGTVVVKDIFAGSSGSVHSSLININNTLYFVADDGIHGKELWKSDGTTAGTVLVQDIFAGPSGSDLGNLMNLNGTLYFKANNGINGSELWKSDGTAAGTILIDIMPGEMGSNPGNFIISDDTLIFKISGESSKRYMRTVTEPDSAWKVVGVGDLDGNGSEDIIVHNGSGQNGAWMMNNGSVDRWLSLPYIDPSSGWKIIDSGRFNSSASSDQILLKNYSGQVGFWSLVGETVTEFSPLSYIDPWSGWRVVGVANFGGTDADDVLLHNDVTGDVGAWISSGSGQVESWSDLPEYSRSGTGKKVAFGDIDGKGFNNILFGNASGQITAWLDSGFDALFPLPYIDPTSGWQMVGVGDVNGDGTDDVVLNNTNSGENIFWSMSNGSAVGWSPLPAFAI
jgi:ELWxxDGT repeat protein